tara:strand:+ start:43 stop:1164 length:1122 start_codon:yes stop_codon:yes gene_type:complete
MLIDLNSKKQFDIKQLKNENDDIDEVIIKNPQILEVVTGNADDLIFIDKSLSMTFSNSYDIEKKSGLCDLLFVDSKATPILIESKLAKNNEIKRKVVGQLLEYKATAVITANTEWNREFFEFKIEKNDKKYKLNNTEKLEKLIKKNKINKQDFWNEFITKFKNGNIKLLIASDEIPTGTKRVIENLNEESTYSEFLGLELNTYIVGETYFLSPKLVGRTEKSKAIKDYVDKEWGFDKFERELSEFPNAVNLIESLKMWEKSGDHIIFDTKKINPSFAVKSSLRKNPIGILYIITKHGKSTEKFIQIRVPSFKAFESKISDFNISEFRRELKSFINSKNSSNEFWRIEIDSFENKNQVDKFIKILNKYSLILKN